MNVSKEAIATFTLDDVTLTVSANSGDGTGSVTGPGINCPGDCSESYTPGTDVTLTATPDLLMLFSGWTGCDTSTSDPLTGGTCDVDMITNRSVTASFDDPVI
jgi:hypothetical protein